MRLSAEPKARSPVKIFNNPVKRKLGKNELVVGSWMAMSHPWVADIMGQCGFEFLVVELEHSTITLIIHVPSCTGSLATDQPRPISAMALRHDSPRSRMSPP